MQLEDALGIFAPYRFNHRSCFLLSATERAVMHLGVCAAEEKKISSDTVRESGWQKRALR